MPSGSHRAKAAGIKHHSGSDNGGSVGGNPQSSPAASQPGPESGTGPGPGPGPQPTPTQHSHTPPPSSPPPSSPPASPGTLVASTSSVILGSSGGAYSGAFTLTAQGGAVSGFTIEDPAPAGDLLITPSSGG